MNLRELHEMLGSVRKAPTKRTQMHVVNGHNTSQSNKHSQSQSNKIVIQQPQWKAKVMSDGAELFSITTLDRPSLWRRIIHYLVLGVVWEKL